MRGIIIPKYSVILNLTIHVLLWLWHLIIVTTMNEVNRQRTYKLNSLFCVLCMSQHLHAITNIIDNRWTTANSTNKHDLQITKTSSLIYLILRDIVPLKNLLKFRKCRSQHVWLKHTLSFIYYTCHSSSCGSVTIY